MAGEFNVVRRLPGVTGFALPSFGGICVNMLAGSG
jgi:hypothetical protein